MPQPGGQHRQRPDAFAVIGLLVWIVGFVFEVTADSQKSRFNADPANKGKFIQTGLWSLSRHPNYFGEIVLWIGVALIAYRALYRPQINVPGAVPQPA